MSTRSTIAIDTGTEVLSIYCHYDGYTEHMWPLLTKVYNTREKAMALIALGNISGLDKSIECPEGHSMKTPVDGYTVAYGRDRGEEGQEAKHWPDWASLLNSDHRQSFNYLFTEKGWTCDQPIKEA